MRFEPMQLCSFAPHVHRQNVMLDPTGLPAIAWSVWRPAFAKASARSLQPPKAFGAGAGDEARTRDVHLGKVVLYQLSYTRSFERDNNVQPTKRRNLLIAFKGSKSLNPKGAFSASYDQTVYEKTIPPLHVLAGAVWHLVSAGSNRKCQPQSNSSDGSNSRDSGGLLGGANGSPQCDVEFSFIRSR